MPKKITAALFIIIATCLLPAISGPLLVDDNLHLGPIIEWLSSRNNTFDLIFRNSSGPFGRPISILSFVLNTLATGAETWPMKLTNLLLHMLTGLCIWALFFRLFRRDDNLSDHAKWAGIAACFWLILPQHISTTFYLIQRMTILATLFSVLSCLLYVVARERIIMNGKGNIGLLLGSAAFAALSVMSKESGLLTPLYCLLIECLYFRPTTEKPRPKIIAWAFRIGVIYPALIAAAYLALNPDYVLAGYIDRPFSMHDRVLTQISVLADYFISTFIPMMRSAGVFNDDFPISSNLGLPQMIILLAAFCLIATAIRLRNSYPSFTAGIGLFFIGHLLESSIFSLEIYFSHRNYFPSIGLVLAATAIIAGVFHRHSAATNSIKPALPFIFSFMLIVYGFASFNRASVWSTKSSLYAQAQINHPTSSRLRSELLIESLYAKQLSAALQQADLAMQTSTANEKRTIQLWRILSYCYAQQSQPSTELDALYKMPADRITMATSEALAYVSAAAEANACPGLDSNRLGKLAGQWAVSTVQPPHSPWVWKAHVASARLLASGGDLHEGFKQAQWAFNDSGYNFDVGILAFQLANSLEDEKAAQEIMKLLRANESRYTDSQRSQLRALRKQ